MDRFRDGKTYCHHGSVLLDGYFRPGSKQGYIFEGGVEARHPPGRAVLRRGFFCRRLVTGQSYSKMPIIEPVPFFTP